MPTVVTVMKCMNLFMVIFSCGPVAASIMIQAGFAKKMFAGKNVMSLAAKEIASAGVS
jgi:hypothetical protein